jgi:hypothetical protein
LPRSQLAINCPAPLLERLRAEAQRQQATATSLVLAWIEAGLDGRLEAPSQAPSSQLEQRLGAVEQRLDVLERSPSPKRVSPPSPKQVSPAPYVGDLPAGGIETAALADLLGIRRGTLNARIARAGGPREGLELEGWCCVGLQVPERGGPARARWETIG